MTTWLVSLKTRSHLCSWPWFVWETWQCWGIQSLNKRPSIATRSSRWPDHSSLSSMAKQSRHKKGSICSNWTQESKSNLIEETHLGSPRIDNKSHSSRTKSYKTLKERKGLLRASCQASNEVRPCQSKNRSAEVSKWQLLQLNSE